MQHEGKLLKELVEDSGIEHLRLASMINVARRTLYSWYERDKVQADKLIIISEAIRMDLSDHFPKLKKMVNNSTVKKYAIEEINLSNRLDDVQEMYMDTNKELRSIKDKMSNYVESMSVKDEVIKSKDQEIGYLRHALEQCQKQLSRG